MWNNDTQQLSRGIGRRVFINARTFSRIMGLAFIGCLLLVGQVAPVEAADNKLLVIKEQGSFMVGGRRLTAPNGQTYPIDHLYAQFQIPPNARSLPLVMVHGAGPDG